MIFNNSLKMDIARACASGDIPTVTKLLKGYLKHFKAPYKTGTNAYYVNKFLCWLGGSEKLPFEVFKIGNSKLPFLSFSTLPAVTCAGAGACLDYCYSFKAWRSPASFLRQCQNTLLMHQFSTIKSEFKKALQLKQFNGLKEIDFRLYVDGDFHNEADLINWMKLLQNFDRGARFPSVRAYGYSKSLNLFLKLHDDGYQFPANYVLNLSNGGIYDSLAEIMKDLYFVRGKFTAHKLTKKTSASKLSKADIKEIRSSYKNKVFICPSDCGKCTSKGHACGNLDTFNNIQIVIPVH